MDENDFLKRMSLPCDFLRKGSGGMAMQVSPTQFTTFPFSKKYQTAKGQGPVMHRAKPYLYYRSMGYENPRVRPSTLQKGKETKSVIKTKKYGSKFC